MALGRGPHDGGLAAGELVVGLALALLGVFETLAERVDLRVDAADLLLDDLGLEPGAALRGLHEAMLRQVFLNIYIF